MFTVSLKLSTSSNSKRELFAELIGAFDSPPGPFQEWAKLLEAGLAVHPLQAEVLLLQ